MSTEVSTEVKKKDNVFLQNLASLSKPENFQKYILGYKVEDEQVVERSLYDVYLDQIGYKKKKKKKKHKKHEDPTSYSLYLTTKKHKKKKKKHKKHWHI